MNDATTESATVEDHGLKHLEDAKELLAWVAAKLQSLSEIHSESAPTPTEATATSDAEPVVTAEAAGANEQVA